MAIKIYIIMTLFESDILYEDNHIIAVNKPVGISVQEDVSGEDSLDNLTKQFLKRRDQKMGNVFLGVVHRLDKPVSGLVLFAKTSKALVRLNEMIKAREIKKTYWAIVSRKPEKESGTLRNHIERDGKKNRSFALNKPTSNSKEAVLNYELICVSMNFYLLEVELITGRHHQIRCQFSKAGFPIKGDLKYGADRSNKGTGGISLHSRRMEFIHPVSKKEVSITAPSFTEDNLWKFFEGCLKE